jgi:hypothetical protein
MRRKLLTLLSAFAVTWVYAQQTIPNPQSPLFSVTSRGSGNTSKIMASTKDASNNLYVAGYLNGDINTNADNATAASFINGNGGNDIYIAKYNSSGVLQWQFTIGGSGSDQANAITIDGSGNIYIAGNINGTSAINMDPANGAGNTITGAGSNDLFVAKYNGTKTPSDAGFYQWAFATGSSTGAETVNAMAIDASNQIYITGNFSAASTGAGTAIDMDPSSNASSGLKQPNGTSSANTDIYLAKYDASVAPSNTSFYKWAFQLGLPSSATGAEVSNAIAVDANGMVYIAGSLNSTTAINMNPTSGAAVNLASSAANTDIVVAKYDGTKTLADNNFFQWAFTRGGVAGADQASAIILDALGNNLYVTGNINGTTAINMDPANGAGNTITGAGGNDIFVAKYASDKTYQWAFAAGGTGADVASAITLDGNNIYIAGTITGSTGTNIDMDPSVATNNITGATATSSADIFVAKYDGSQTSVNANLYKWAFTLGSSGSTDDARTITVDANTRISLGGSLNGDASVNVYTGSSATVTPTIGATSAMVISYDGTQSIGSSFYASSNMLGNGGTATVVNASAIDAAGNVYVCGNFGSGRITLGNKNLTNNSNLTDGFVAKYDKTGTVQWAFNIGGANSDQALAIALDSTGTNVFVTGSVGGATAATNIYMDPANPSTSSFQLAASSTGTDIFLAKYSTASGAYAGAFNIGLTTVSESGRGVAVDNNGNVFLTGLVTGNNAAVPFGNSVTVTTTGGASSADIFVAKYTGTGTITSSNCQWAYAIGGNGADQGNGIMVDNSGGVYVVGQVAYNATAATGSVAGAVVLNNNGSNILTNSTSNLIPSGNFTDIFVSKFSDAGTSATVQWAFNAGGASVDIGNSIAVDAAKGIYITGTVTNPTLTYTMNPASSSTISGPGNGATNTTDVFVAKYDGSQATANSNLYKWAFVVGGTYNDAATGIALDAANGVYVTGGFGTNVTANTPTNIYMNPASIATPYSVPARVVASAQDIYVVKYNGNLSSTNSSFYQWFAPLTNTTSTATTDGSNTIASGPYGVVYGGKYTGSSTDFDATAGTQAVSSVIAGTAQSMFISTLPPQYAHWTGATNTDWGTSTNWAYGSVPATSVSAAIPSVTNLPVIAASTTQTAYDVVINSGASITNNGTLNIGSVINNNGSFTSTSGTIGFNGANAQIIPALSFATNTVKGLTINNTTGVTLGGTLKVTSLVTPTAGTLTTGGFLTLGSTSSQTASVAQGTSPYISGNVTVQQYLSAQRGWRMLGNPLSTATSISSLASNSTLTLGSSDVYDYTTAGWVLNSTNSSSNWTGGTGVLAFVRGIAGQGTGGNYSGGGPGNVTLNVTGTVNQGNQSYAINTWNGTNNSTEPTKFTLISNPYPSPVSLRSVLKSTTGIAGSFSSAFYSDATNFKSIITYYNPATGAANAQTTGGAYATADLASADFILPAFSSFFIEANAAISNLAVRFVETGKSSTATNNSMFGVNDDDRLVLQINNKDGINYDNWYLRFDNNSKSTSLDNRDGTKMNNSLLSLYSIASDNIHLSNDSRNTSNKEAVQLGLVTTKQQNYTISVAHNGTNKELYFKDNLLNTSTKLNEGASYSFDVTGESNTQGEQRFEIVTMQAPALTLPLASIKLSVSPNPVSDILNITSSGNTTVRITNILGQVVRTVNTTDQTIKISVSDLQQGLYIVEVKNDTQSITEKIIKN